MQWMEGFGVRHSLWWMVSVKYHNIHLNANCQDNAQGNTVCVFFFLAQIEFQGLAITLYHFSQFGVIL
jgi:hypothetical protein